MEVVKTWNLLLSPSSALPTRFCRVRCCSELLLNNLEFSNSKEKYSKFEHESEV
jgi:hypothetical protein